MAPQTRSLKALPTIDEQTVVEEFKARKAALAEVANVQLLDVTCNPDGSLTVNVDPEAAARIVGRDQFGPAEPVRKLLEDRIADAWYAADCPVWERRNRSR